MTIKGAGGALVAALTIAICGTAQAGTVRSCPEVQLSPGSSVSASHYGMTKIRARDVSCTVAQAVAKAATDAGRSHKYSSHGFSCTGVPSADGPVHFTCTHKKVGRRTPRVTFDAWGVG